MTLAIRLALLSMASLLLAAVLVLPSSLLFLVWAAPLVLQASSR